jgi:cell division protease FtsH
MSTQQKKRGFNWLGFFVIAVVALFIFGGVFNGRNVPEITKPEFYAMIGYEGDTAGKDPTGGTFTASKNKVKAVVRQGTSTYYIFLIETYHNSKNADGLLNNFLNNPSGYADAFVYSTDNVLPAIIARQYTEIPADPTGYTQIVTKDRAAPTGLLDQILPFVYIFGLAAVVFFMSRGFSGRSGLGNMGRNRATVTMDSPIRFTDVAGIEEEKEEVQEIVQFLRNPQKFLSLGARIPKGFLLVGSPGTGKTLLAKAIAGEAHVPFFSISGSDFSEMLVGVGPSRMRDLFEQAKANAPSIIFIDEIDSIARMRGVGVSGVSDENEQTLNQLLVQMDGFTKSEGVIVLAATNRPDVLDQALLRPGRFDRQIIVQMPDVRGREKILQVHSKNKPLAADVDLKRVASIISGFSGADIENLMNESAIIAAKKHKTRITMQDITEGINKVLLGPQKRSRIITDEDKRITAYHEAGHAVVSRILQKDHVVQEVSIIPRGMAAGYTLTNERDTESHHKSKGYLKNQLAMYMSGRTAEEIFVGDICTGSTNDLKVATNLAEKMVTSFGMSDKLGPLFYGKDEEIALRMYNDKHHSEVLQSTIDGEVKTLIMAAEKQSKDILNKESARVRVMANVLLARETIYADDINLIMEGKSEAEVIASMEKRESANKEQEKKDKTEQELAALERDLNVVMDMANAFLEARIIDESKMEKLRENFELARSVTRAGGRPRIVPTLDNLDTYAKTVKVEPEVKAGSTRQKAEDAAPPNKSKSTKHKAEEGETAPSKTRKAPPKDPTPDATKEK